MKLTRRALVAAASAAPAIAATAAQAQAAPLPAKAAFAKMPFTYLDAGSTHPMPLAAKAALEEYLRYKTQDGSVPAGYSVGAMEEKMVAAFGALVGASPDELSIIQST